MNRGLQFEGRVGRAAYAALSLAVFFAQHVVMLAALYFGGGKLPALPWWFWFNPFRAFLLAPLGSVGAGSVTITLGMLATLATDVALVALAWRRARRLDRGAWVAVLAIVPVMQLGAIAWLAVAPDRPETMINEAARGVRLDARTVVLGVLLGVGSIVGAVALSTLVFGVYGFALFLISPFLIATAVGYLANRNGSLGLFRTFGLVGLAFLLGAAALIGFAFEGLICLLWASPLIAVMGAVGAALGLGLARLGRPGRGASLSSIAFVPIVLAAEALLPPHAAFDSVEFTDIAAPPAAVWDAVVHMGPIPAAPAAPFRWGLAYPLRGEILGTGVGSIRRGVFSTGVAYERVTEWAPGRSLSFIVLSDPPTMRELSPYAHTNSPHVSGYFRTLDARFTLTPVAGGGTRLTLATRHELDLEPALYWVPIANWAVHANKVRVLAHFREQAEAAGLGRRGRVGL